MYSKINGIVTISYVLEAKIGLGFLVLFLVWACWGGF